MNRNKRILVSVGLIIVVLIIGYYVLSIFSKKTGTICLVRGITGLPCPSCGMTRAVKEFINGNISVAFYYHPLFWLPFIVTIITLIKPKWGLKIIITAIILLAIVYIIRMSVLFPNNEPMKYNQRGILQQIFKNSK